MFSRFWNDLRGNFITLTCVAMVPIMGALVIAVDYGELSNERQAVLSALDAANIATARRFVEGATDEELRAYAREFFQANLGQVNPLDTDISLEMPNSTSGGGTMKLSAVLRYQPNFLPAAVMLIGTTVRADTIEIRIDSEVRLKNTLEVAMVLDNSGSMDYIGTGSGKKRIVLLKEAAKQLVDTIAGQAAQVKQVNKPVQFALVPFAASVNVGPAMAGESWMDQDGISPIHHENFDWSAFTSSTRAVTRIGGVYYKKGADWGTAQNQKMTRFQLFADLTRTASQTWNAQQTCTATKSNGQCKTWAGGYDYTYAPYASWGGCVEARPFPYNTNDAPPASNNPASLFVPMFAPDETDLRDGSNRSAAGNWWGDLTSGSINATRQAYTLKYYTPAPHGTAAAAAGTGPNASCTTKPITPLVDVGSAGGLAAIKGAIDAMSAGGATNVPEGLAWGWRTVSGGEPFSEGRPDAERGNDKAVIVLTDGENTYYTPSSLGSNDLAANKSTYSAYGYAGRTPTGYSYPRIFQGVPATLNKNDYSNANYTRALNAQFASVCANAKTSKVLLLTVALDLDPKDAAEKAQIDALESCASDSRFRKRADGKPAKLFWNATGANLADTFKEIADELSNLRIVG